MDPIAQLLAIVDAYREARGVKDQRVSTLVFNDWDRIGALRNGEE